MKLDPHDLIRSQMECCDRRWNEAMETTPNSDDRDLALARYHASVRMLRDLRRKFRIYRVARP